LDFLEDVSAKTSSARIYYLRPLERPVINMAEAEVSGKVSGLVRMLLQSPDSNCRTDKLLFFIANIANFPFNHTAIISTLVP
jgi:hypothetical protein